MATGTELVSTHRVFPGQVFTNVVASAAANSAYCPSPENRTMSCGRAQFVPNTARNGGHSRLIMVSLLLCM
jgi:hypothetical protein